MSKCFNIPKTQGISKHGKLTLKSICNGELVDELENFDPTKGDIEFVVIHRKDDDEDGGVPSQDFEELKLKVQTNSKNIATNTEKIEVVEADFEVLDSKIANFNNSLALKEDVANKSNEINDSTVLYPNNNAVNQLANIWDKALKDVQKLVPYVLQGLGDSEKDTISQATLTKKFEAIIEMIEAGLGGIDLPDVDLTDYLTASQVHSAIRDITGLLEDLDTTNEMSLVGAINELLLKINNTDIYFNSDF